MGLFRGAVHELNLALSVLAIPLIVGVVERLANARAALVAGLMLALLPLPVALSRTEIHFVLVATLQLAAVLGALREDRLGDALCFTSAALLVNLRPLQALFLLLPLACLLFSRRWWPVAAISAVMGLRAMSLPVSEGAPIDWHLYLSLDFWRRLLLPIGEAPALDLALEPTVTPVLVPALAAVGVMTALRDRRWRQVLVPAFALALALGPYLPKTTPFADPLRFQLPAQSWWVILAALGLSRVLRWQTTSKLGTGSMLGVGLLGVASLWWARDPQGRWAWQEEYRLLVELSPSGALYNPRDSAAETVRAAGTTYVRLALSAAGRSAARAHPP